jgi:hypothetical protein
MKRYFFNKLSQWGIRDLPEDDFDVLRWEGEGGGLGVVPHFHPTVTFRSPQTGYLVTSSPARTARLARSGLRWTHWLRGYGS